MLAAKGDSFNGKTVAISGSGNVAQFAMEKVLQLGGKPVTVSDSSGYIYKASGFTAADLADIMELKNVKRGRVKELAEANADIEFFSGERPWGVKCDVALPCATQNELNGDEAKTLLSNGCMCVAEGLICQVLQKQLLLLLKLRFCLLLVKLQMQVE